MLIAGEVIMTTEFILFPGYEISYRPLNGTLINTVVLEDPECLRMTVDELLDEFGEVSIRKKGE